VKTKLIEKLSSFYSELQSMRNSDKVIVTYTYVMQVFHEAIYQCKIRLKPLNIRDNIDILRTQVHEG
jgi:hypothetical protein